MGIHFLCYAHGNKHIESHDAILDNFATLRKMLFYALDKNNYMCFP
jgi:hypothetical protein